MITPNVYCGVVLNIPPGFKIRQLREYFDDFAERRLLKTFHFLQRKDPRYIRSGKTMMCPVLFESYDQISAFIKRYDQKLWLRDDEYLETRCHIVDCSSLFVAAYKEEVADPRLFPAPNTGRSYQQPVEFIPNSVRSEREKESTKINETFLEDLDFCKKFLSKNKLSSLRELHPPLGLPQVGYFLFLFPPLDTPPHAHMPFSLSLFLVSIRVANRGMWGRLSLNLKLQ